MPPYPYLIDPVWAKVASAPFQPHSGQRHNIGNATMLQIIRRTLIGLLSLLASLPFITSWTLAAEPVDLLLVLASDVSRSIDHQKFLLQRDGYAATVSNPHVLGAIKSGPIGKIAICFVEWSGFGAQKLVIDWK